MDHRVTEDDLTALGGFEGALSRHVKRQIGRLFDPRESQIGPVKAPSEAHDPEAAGAFVAKRPGLRTDSERFQVLLTKLTLRQGDGTLTTDLWTDGKFREEWDGRATSDEMLPRACEFRLLRLTTRRIDETTDERLVSLGHDALAKVAQPWKEELEKRAERRKWLRRAVVGALFGVILGTVSVFAVLFAREAVEARDRAESSANETQAVQSFFENSVLAAVRPRGIPGDSGNEVTLRDALRAADYWISTEFQNMPAKEASIRSSFGRTYRRLGEADRAIDEHNRALQLRKANLGPDHRDTLRSEYELAEAYNLARKFDLSIPLFTDTLRALERRARPGDPDILDCQNGLANAYMDSGDVEKAIPLYEKTVDERISTVGANDSATLRTETDLATAYREARRLDQAVSLYEKTMDAQSKTLGPDHPDTMWTKSGLASAYELDGKLDQAISIHKDVVKSQMSTLGANHFYTLVVKLRLAKAYARRAVGRTLFRSFALWSMATRTCWARKVTIRFTHRTTLPQPMKERGSSTKPSRSSNARWKLRNQFTWPTTSGPW